VIGLSKTDRHFKILLGCCLLCWWAYPLSPVGAQTDIEALTHEIESLKARISELEVLKERLLELEAALQKARTKRSIPTEDAPERQKEIELGGAVRFNYAYRDFQKNNRSKGGDLEFDLFRLNVDGGRQDFLFSAEYRWYRFMDVIHHGWIGYDFSDAWQAQLGVTQVPFGILPYASHNWWFGVPYYIGLEDDYDLGVKWLYEGDPWNFQFAFFKNGEWGDAGETERYSFDVVKTQGEENEETNTLNVRAAYTLDHSEGYSTEIGVSGLWGQLFNETTDSFGNRWAAAAHLNGTYDRWNLMLEVARYVYDPHNPAGVDDRTVMMGAFGTSFPVAAEGTLLVANVSYALPVNWNTVDSFTFYNDYSILKKDESGFDDTQINTLGVLISAPPVHTYIDLITGKNAPFLGVPEEISGISRGLGRGEPDAEWETRFNVNVGYYF